MQLGQAVYQSCRSKFAARLPTHPWWVSGVFPETGLATGRPVCLLERPLFLLRESYYTRGTLLTRPLSRSHPTSVQSGRVDSSSLTP